MENRKYKGIISEEEMNLLIMKNKVPDRRKETFKSDIENMGCSYVTSFINDLFVIRTVGLKNVFNLKEVMMVFCPSQFGDKIADITSNDLVQMLKRDLLNIFKYIAVNSNGDKSIDNILHNQLILPCYNTDGSSVLKYDATYVFMDIKKSFMETIDAPEDEDVLCMVKLINNASPIPMDAHNIDHNPEDYEYLRDIVEFDFFVNENYYNSDTKPIMMVTNIVTGEINTTAKLDELEMLSIDFSNHIPGLEILVITDLDKRVDGFKYNLALPFVKDGTNGRLEKTAITELALMAINGHKVGTEVIYNNMFGVENLNVGFIPMLNSYFDAYLSSSEKRLKLKDRICAKETLMVYLSTADGVIPWFNRECDEVDGDNIDNEVNYDELLVMTGEDLVSISYGDRTVREVIDYKELIKKDKE